MMRLVAFLIAVATMQGCYLSTSVEEELVCEALPFCDAGYIRVDACNGVDPCYEAELCGSRISCALDTCEPGEICPLGAAEVPWCDEGPDCFTRVSCGEVHYCQPNLCNALPTCPPGEMEVASCGGEGVPCRPVSECGQTIYCARCDAPQCDEGQGRFEGACPPDAICEARTSCGETIYCGRPPLCEPDAPCGAARSSILAEGPGLCPPEMPSPDPRSNCMLEDRCGEIYFCITVCFGDDFEVRTPAECLVGGVCYPARGMGETWCTGSSVDVCDGEPVCDPNFEEELPLAAECPLDWSCRFVEECGTTIQCGYLIPRAG